MAETNDEKKYLKTLNMAETAFPMKASLSVREPERLAKWEAADLYGKMVARRDGAPSFILHDGPPYANGHIHIGHALNKILKDIVVKYRSMGGFRSEYVPGWDCHGLPIEMQVDKKLGSKKETITKAEKRALCREYAAGFVDIQRDEFKRLGVLGAWDRPYRTMTFDYEAGTLRELGRFVEAGSVYKGKKPVYWCGSCRTALAEAEVEYAEHESPSIHVKFPFAGDPASIDPALSGKKVFFVIWTTTPWTIPSNLGVALHPEYEYVALEAANGEVYIVAEGLAEAFRAGIGIGETTTLATFTAPHLEKMACRHPFIDRDSLIVLADYVTLDAGTGCVHTAPGHGREDYETGLRYGMEIYAPLDDAGRFLSDVADFAGLNVFAANPVVAQKIADAGMLLSHRKLSHSYPHCWRCHHPVIFRATAQWFISMEKTGLRAKALEEIAKVRWIPSWGRDRIEGMIANRPDWCISRQRSWGVPIAVFRCEACGEHLLDRKLIDRVADFFETEGADAWFSRPVSDFLPEGIACPKCGKTEFGKENDILDVWFDSGVSYATVCEGKEGLGIPVDLYLEGSDQHRGWFHSTLLASVGTRGAAPYKAVLTHGFVVDGKGVAMSKSKGNVIAPEKVIAASGAEILRLWVASSDYRDDVRLSDDHLKQLSESYRKIRNTVRFLLMNVGDFDPTRDTVPFSEMAEIDRFILLRFDDFARRVQSGYEAYDFHVVFHAASTFCSVDLSAFYCDVLKDRLYCEAKTGALRRSAQTALFTIARGFLQLMAPVLSFTADEAWEHLPAWDGKAESVFLTDLPTPVDHPGTEEVVARWERIVALRGEVAQPMEAARKAKVLGKDLDARVVVAPGPFADLFASHGHLLREALGVSAVEVGDPAGEGVFDSVAYPGLKVSVTKAPWGKCERCWSYAPEVGTASNPEICIRCAGVVGA